MLRKGIVSKFIKTTDIDHLPDFLKGYYNNLVITNKTIKKPYACQSRHKNKKTCPICCSQSKIRKSSRFYKNSYLLKKEIY